LLLDSPVCFLHVASLYYYYYFYFEKEIIILRNDESFWGLESALRVKTRRFFFWKFRDFEVVELSWVTYPSEKRKKSFLRCSYCNGWTTQVKNAKIFQRGEKYEDFSKWSCCNGWLAQVKIKRLFEVVKNAKIFQNGLVVMDDLPRWKMKGVF